MDSDLINISLKQGKEFKNYQKKIKTSVEKSKRVNKKKTKEGFAMPAEMVFDYPEDSINLLQQRDERAKIVNQTNQSDLNQLTNLENQYSNVETQYTNLQNNMNANSLVSINRTSSKNPYLNKNIRFTTGHVCHVTNQGVVKWIPSNEIWDSLKNCSDKSYINVNIPWLSEYGIPGTVIPTNPSLISGTNMVANQGCGNEGNNVYVTKLVTTPSTSYVGCYNDKPAATLVNGIPIMNSSNNVNGFMSSASSVYVESYRNSNQEFGPWLAFDQNPNTYWHSSHTNNNTMYNEVTGVYSTSNKNGVTFTSKNSGILTVKGEFLQINMPGVNTPSVKNIRVTKYSITPRKDNNLFLKRSPNTWYVLGYKIDTDGQGKWYEIDHQIEQKFESSDAKTYNVTQPGDYGAYIILTVKVGNYNETKDRTSVQIAGFDLFVSSDSSFNSEDSAMIYNSSSIGYTTYSECEKYAINNDFKFFGLQDLQANGTAACLVSNDYDKTIKYGSASKQETIIPIWASNTQSRGQSYIAQVVGTGQLTVYDINNPSATIYKSNEVVPGCTNWGTMLIDSATYGGNCRERFTRVPFGRGQIGVSIGNVTDKVAGGTVNCNFKENCSIPISNGTFGDPVVGCSKGFDVAYKCGGTPFTRNLNPAEGQTMILDCKDHMQTACQFYLILQDDCNMCLYKGKDPSDRKDGIWMSHTNGKQRSPNSEWVASKGKYGRNYLKLGETLATNEWIGSNDGSIKLIMQTDGNLVLYTSEEKAGCSVKNNKTYGSNSINAVYKIEPIGNKNVLGKVAYIDGDSMKKEFPSSLLSHSNQYDLMNDFDSAGHDIQQVNTSNKEQGCIDSCNANSDCAGFVYQPNGNICYLKNSGMYPMGEKQLYTNSGIIMGVRRPQLGANVSSSCSKDMVNIDSIQYDNYIKGVPMTSSTRCGSSIVLDEDKNKLTKIQNNLLSIGDQIAGQANNLHTKNDNIYNTMSKNSIQFNKDVVMYKENDNKIKSELNLPKRFQINKNTNVNKREGMKSMTSIDTPEKNLTMNDINSMLSDTDIRVLQENYSYIFWSILAVGILTVTISKIKK